MRLLAVLLFLNGCASFDANKPTVVVLLQTHEEEAGLRNTLKEAGFKVVSLTYPCHGKETGGLACWRQRLERGDTFDQFVDSAVATVKETNAKALIGISRSAYLAALIAERGPQTVSYALIAPVLNLSDLQEFAGAQPFRSTSCETLNGRRVFITIGRNDQRVNTKRSVDLANSCAGVTLLLTNTDGHFHADIDRVIVDWLKSGSY